MVFIPKDWSGNKYHKLTVVKRSHVGKNGQHYYVCRCDCGKIKVINIAKLHNGQVKSCGCLMARSGERNGFWRGGRRKLANGYILIYQPNHPNRTKRNYVYEHRLVMEKHIGRYLTKGETVHHKNGVRDDNCISNLELRVGHHGAGADVNEKVIYALNILRTYAPYFIIIDKRTEDSL